MPQGIDMAELKMISNSSKIIHHEAFSLALNLHQPGVPWSLVVCKVGSKGY